MISPPILPDLCEPLGFIHFSLSPNLGVLRSSTELYCSLSDLLS